MDTFSVNGDSMPGPMKVTMAAFDAVDPGCVPTFTTSCQYTIRALQMTFADFMIEPTDTLSWSNGTATLTGPITASDDGTGIGVPSATALLAFEVAQGTEQRVAVASGMLSLRINLDSNSTEASVLLRGTGFDFGGYEIDDIFFNGTLTAQ